MAPPKPRSPRARLTPASTGRRFGVPTPRGSPMARRRRFAGTPRRGRTSPGRPRSRVSVTRARSSGTTACSLAVPSAPIQTRCSSSAATAALIDARTLPSTSGRYTRSIGAAARSFGNERPTRASHGSSGIPRTATPQRRRSPTASAWLCYSGRRGSIAMTWTASCCGPATWAPSMLVPPTTTPITGDRRARRSSTEAWSSCRPISREIRSSLPTTFRAARRCGEHPAM